MLQIKSVCLAQLKFGEGAQDQTYSQMWQVLLAVTRVTWHRGEHRPICSSSCTKSRAQRQKFCRMQRCLCVTHRHNASYTCKWTCSYSSGSHIKHYSTSREEEAYSIWLLHEMLPASLKRSCRRCLATGILQGLLQQMCLGVAGGSGGHHVRMIA